MDKNWCKRLGNNHGNFQLCRFTKSENIVKSFKGGYFFDLHCMYWTYWCHSYPITDVQCDSLYTVQL